MATNEELDKRLKRLEVLHVIGGVALIVIVANFLYKRIGKSGRVQ